jgi:hypothetical protein
MPIPGIVALMNTAHILLDIGDVALEFYDGKHIHDFVYEI